MRYRERFRGTDAFSTPALSNKIKILYKLYGTPSFNSVLLLKAYKITLILHFSLQRMLLENVSIDLTGGASTYSSDNIHKNTSNFSIRLMSYCSIKSANQYPWMYKNFNEMKY